MEKKELMILIGENVKACRLRAGMTQAQLAEVASVGVPFIANIESGQKMMSLMTLVAVSDALKVSSDALLKEEVRLDSESSLFTLLHGLPQEYLQKLEQIMRICLKEFPMEESHDSKSMV